jgi:hypothetical protein
MAAEGALTGDISMGNAEIKYECNPKHKDPRQPGHGGSLCPQEIDEKMAQTLFAASELVGQKRYAVHCGRAYCAQSNAEDVLWHGYPVGWVEVPEALRNQWKKQKKVTHREINQHWD